MTLSMLHEEMTSKYGFHDGAHEPDNAEEIRDMLVKIINEDVLKESEIEAVGYDRAGLHNSTLILYQKREEPGKFIDPPVAVIEWLIEEGNDLYPVVNNIEIECDEE